MLLPQGPALFVGIQNCLIIFCELNSFSFLSSRAVHDNYGIILNHNGIINHLVGLSRSHSVATLVSSDRDPQHIQKLVSVTLLIVIFRWALSFSWFSVLCCIRSCCRPTCIRPWPKKHLKLIQTTNLLLSTTFLILSALTMIVTFVLRHGVIILPRTPSLFTPLILATMIITSTSAILLPAMPPFFSSLIWVGCTARLVLGASWCTCLVSVAAAPASTAMISGPATTGPAGLGLTIHFWIRI